MGMVHGIGHMISAIKNVHHGRINSMMMVPIERFNMMAKPKTFAELATCFGVDTRGMSTIQAAEKAIDEMERLRNDVGITNISLKQFDVTEKDIDHVAEWVIKDVCCEANPRDINQSQVKEILRGLLN